MRISRKKSKQNQISEKRYRINHQIRTTEVRLINETGESVGIVDTSQALAMARDLGMDLIEVSPLANPPVAKILDYSKMKYQEQKAKRKERSAQKKTETKGLRLSLRISEHDKQVRIKQSAKFLSNGDKVKLEMLLRGRERQHADLAREIINKFIESVNQLTPLAVEQSIKVQGGKLSAVIAPKS